MTVSSKIKSGIAGVLVANSAPHLATAVSGRRHLTPLAGRESSAATNAIWATANLVAAMVLLRSAADSSSGSRRWGSELIAYEAGHLGWATWMAVSEYLLKPNWGYASPRAVAQPSAQRVSREPTWTSPR